MINYVLVTHLIGATIWTGGHLILCLVVLPKVLRNKNIADLMSFESQFEKIGMPALIVQVVTGFWMAFKMLPNTKFWLGFNNDLSTLISIKLILLSMTVLVALHARFRVIPKLTSYNLKFFAAHIVTVTFLSVGFVIVGSLFRTGLS